MPPKRPHSPTNDSRSNAKLRGNLSWNKAASQPKFLRNALAALQGQPSSNSDKGLGPDGRPIAPSRPGGAADESSEEDEWDFGRGEEAPAVVQLKEKHIDRDEVDRLRAEAKASSAADPTASSSAPPPQTKNTGSLNFASGNAKDKAPKASDPGAAESWDDVIQRAKADAAAKALSAEQAKEEAAKQKDKDEKKKKRDKVKAKKQIKMLSFDDE